MMVTMMVTMMTMVTMMVITWRGIVFMGGVRSMLTDELEHWETVLLARRRPSH